MHWYVKLVSRRSTYFGILVERVRRQASRTDQVPAEIKERRAHELSELGDQLRIQYAQRRIGSHELVAVEQEGWGMTESYYKVRIDGFKQGALVDVCLTGVDDAAIMRA